MSNNDPLDFGLIGLIAAMDDPDVSVRANAVKALSESDNVRVIDLLVQALYDANGTVRELAIDGLTRFNGHAVPALLEQLQSPEPVVRSNVADMLGRIGDRRAVEHLITVLQDKDIGVCASAVRALGRIKDERAVEPLIAILEEVGAFGEVDGFVRSNAARIIGRLGDEREVPVLLKALNDPQEMVRASAAKGLGLLGDERAVEPLIGLLLMDNSPKVKQSSVEALERIDSPQARDALKQWRGE